MKSRRHVLALAIAAAVALGGCASLPSPEEMKAEVANYQLPKMPDPARAMVYVVRPSAAGTLIRFNVFLNDQQDASEMGYTRGSQYIYFLVPPGDHKLYSKAENWAELAITAKAGEVIFVQQEPSMGFIMARNSMTRLDDTTGRWHVKKLEAGTIHKTEK